MALIEIKNLCKTFGSGDGAVHALEDVSLSIEAGEIFGIIGLSGAGKSTLVRCMNLLERPTSGEIWVNGQELEKMTPKELRRARGIRQEELAEALEVSRQTIGSLENGRYNPSILLAFKIARYFGMTIEEIFLYEEEPS